MTEAFSLSYDYRCPFAKNIHLHVIAALRAGADFAISFEPWSLSQGPRAPGAPDVWEDPAMADDVAALAASVSVRDQQPDKFLATHEALFRARHEKFIRLSTYKEVREVLDSVGVDVALVDSDLASGRPQKAMGESFHLYEKYEAFGVPTFLVDNDATFVRYMDPPNGDDEASRQLISSIVSLIKGTPGLNEFKHTMVPN